MRSLVACLVREDEGQDLIEYALLATLVALAAAVGATALGTNLDGWYTSMAGRVTTWSGTAGS